MKFYNRTSELAELVRRRKENFKSGLLAAKVEHLKHKVLQKYSVETKCLSLEDM